MTHDATISPEPAALGLRSGLPAAPPRHMPTLFTLFIFWWTIVAGATVFLPWLATRFQETRFSEPRHLAAWGFISFLSAAHGAAAYLATFKRGFSPWWFFAGALPGLGTAVGLEALGAWPDWGKMFLLVVLLVFTVSVALLAFVAGKRPVVAPRRPDAFLCAADRLAFAFGNLWWGISQIVLITAALIRATLFESEFGAELGNEAAYARFYNAPWFGGITVLFFVTLYAATMRKYPFRLSQAGWLSVHAGLLILLVGCLMMFFGSFEGRMAIYEGETAASLRSSRQRDLVIEAPSLGYTGRFPVEVDRDPTREDVSQVIDIDAPTREGREQIRLTIDRYIVNAEYYERIVPRPDNQAGRAGVEVEVSAPGSTTKHALIEADRERGSIDQGMLSLHIVRAASEDSIADFGFRFAPTDKKRGKLTVENSDGLTLCEFEILVGPREGNPAEGAVLTGRKTLGDGRTIELERFFSTFADDRGRVRDADPAIASLPGVTLLVDGPDGPQRHFAVADGRSGVLPSPKGKVESGLKLRYRCRSEFRTPPRSIAFVAGPGERKSVLITGSDGRSRVEPFEPGRDYRFSNDAPVRVTARKWLASADYVAGFEPAKRSTGDRVLHVRAEHVQRQKTTESWIMLYRGRQPLEVGGRMLRIGYQPKTIPVDFSLSLLDFRGIHYPNSRKPKAYETNVVLRDDAEKVREALLIDMNHPLTWKGMRFFNSNPIEEEDTNRRGVILQVTTNPGYGPIVAGSIIVGFGLLIVFFFKPRLRRIEQRRRAVAGTPSVRLEATANLA